MAARWLILGCGYVGRELGRRALRCGVLVTAVTRNADFAEELRRDGFSSVVVADIADDDWHAAANGEFDAVINCVSSGRTGVDGFRRSYVEGQRSFSRWLKQGRVRSAVYTSSTSVYPQTGGELVDESFPTRPATEASQLLLEAEEIFRAATAPLCSGYVFRLAGIYGPHRHHLLDRLLTGETTFPGSGSDVLNLIHRDDVCSAVERVLDPDLPGVPPGVYNVCSGQHPSRRDVVDWLAARLDRPKPVFDSSLMSPRQKRRVLPGGSVPCRRIASLRFQTLSGWTPRYADFRDGYEMILREIDRKPETQ